MKKLDIIVPAKNEAGNIKKLVTRIDAAMTKAQIDYRVIIVNDYSTDTTEDEIKKASQIFKNKVILHNKKGTPGKAYAVLEGAKLANTEHIAMIDADLQYPPEALPQMLAIAQEKGVAVANRVTHNTTKFRKLGSKINKFLFGKVLLGLSCDAQSGLKVFKKEILEHLDEGIIRPWALDVPLLHTAKNLGYEIGHTEIDFQDRQLGDSKINYAKATKEIVTTSLRQKLKGKKTFVLRPTDESSPIGAGVAHKKKRFVTHTRLHHEDSALKTFAPWQTAFLTTLALSFLLGLLINPLATLIAVTGTLTLIYFVDVMFGLFILVKSLHSPPELKFSQKELDEIDERTLPVYTILCPLYKEAQILPQFLKAIEKLEWPKGKLDVKLLLEENDQETQDAAKNLDMPDYVQVLVVPNSEPKTKPKACNYGLHFAKGEYVVVYDAEDHPDPLQLKKAYLGFQKTSPNTICLQSKLNYYNPDHNLLTRLFTAEYSLWFDLILPGLQSIETHIPLGGTSNHFRTKDLVGIHGWDPFNVTEDCDLGVRLFKSGYKTAIIDSTTYEEANSSIKNWIRQRSRWIKGYLQTYLVHTRNPVKFFKTHGKHAFIFQLIIGLRISFILINPILWATTIAYFAFRPTIGLFIESVYPAPIFYLAVFALIVGNFLYIYNYMIGAAKRGHYWLVKYVFLIPLYWVMTSLAASVAFYQLLIKPHYWEKTHHGLHLGFSIPKTRKTKRVNTAFAKKLATNSATAGGALIIAGGVASFVNLLYSAFLGRALPETEFGLISLAGNLFALTAVGTDAFGGSITYKSAYLFGKLKTPAKNFWKKSKNKAIVFGTLATLLWVASIPFMSEFFQAHSVLPFILLTPIWALAFMLAANNGFLSGSLKFYFLALIYVTEAVVKLIAAYLFISLGLAHLVYAAIPISLLTAVALGIVFISFIKGTKAKKNPEPENFPKAFFASSILIKLSAVAFLSLDVILAKHLLDPFAAGQYALLALAGKIVFFLGTLFSQFINPLVSKAEGQGKDSKKIFYILLGAVAAISYSAFILLGLFGELTVVYIFGDKTQAIISYLPIYTLGMASFATATGVVTYHQIKKDYLFPVTGLVIALIQVWAILNFGTGVKEIALIVGVLGIAYLPTVLLLHFIYNPAKIILRNVLDFLGLFGHVPAAARAESNGYLRILLLNWRDTKHIWAGGAEVYVQEIAKRWAQEGHKVTLFCGNDGKSPRNEKVDGVQVVRRGGFYTVYIWAFLYYILRFRNNFDVVVESENGTPFFTPLYVRVPKFLLVHHVHQEVFRTHLSFPLSTIARFVEKRLMPTAYRNQKFITVSNSSKRELSKIGCSKRNNIDIVNPAVNLSNFKKVKKTKNPTFIYMGRHKAYKNIHIALHAFSKVVQKFPEAQLTIAGDGEVTGELKALSKKLKLTKSVKFLGRVSEARKAKILGESWVALQPSSFEGWGITVIEANAARTPVIASNVNGLKDSVIDGKTGILFPVGNTSALSKIMIELAEDEKFRKDLSENAYLWAKQFNWDKSASEFLKIINKEVSKKTNIYLAPNLAS